MDQKINLSINEGDSFFAHQASINFNPTQIFFDFKNITPRVDDRNKQGATLVLKHNVVMFEPYHAKVFRDLLDKVIKDYEKEFGKLKKPTAVAKAEKKGKKMVAKSDTPNYFG